MSPKIHTPVKGYTGTVVGVDFKNGEGETTNPAAIAYFNRHGYTVIADEKPREPTEREKLVAEAKELGLDAKGKVDELKARIAEHKANAKTAETTPAGTDEQTSTGNPGEEETS